MRVALIHDWLTDMRGGERCLEIFCELFPQADIYTLLHVPGSVSATIERMPIRTSFIQKFPFSKKGYRRYLPFFPMAAESFNLNGYDLVLSSSHCVAKGVIPSPDALHIAYVHTPMRYAWNMYDEYFGKSRNWIIPFFIHYLRMWDVASSHRVDHFICNSHNVERRIRKFYRREGEVIYPPVDCKRFTAQCHKENYFLIVSSLVAYKRIDLAVEAFNRLGYPLKIIGSGPEGKKLKAMARSKVEFCGWLSENAVAHAYTNCRALIFPGEEDFGIVPLEAMASGRPVIAYGRGGALETVIAHDQGDSTEAGVPTGLFFDEPNPDAVIDAVERFVAIETDFDPPAIRDHALKWDREIFKKKIKDSIHNKIHSK